MEAALEGPGVGGRRADALGARGSRQTAPTPTRATSSAYSGSCGWPIYMKLIPSVVVENIIHIVHIVMH